MDDFIREMPKAELHLHLEGSVEPETLHELDPATPLEEFRALYRYADFDGLSESLRRGGKAAAHAARITRWSRGGCWSGWRPRTCATPKSSWRPAWCCGRGRSSGRSSTPCAEAAAGSPVEVRWILDAVRQFGVEQAHAGGGTGGGARGPRRGGVRHRRQRRARTGRMVHGGLRVRQQRGAAADGARGREHGAGIGVGRAEDWARSASATGSRRRGTRS